MSDLLKGRVGLGGSKGFDAVVPARMNQFGELVVVDSQKGLYDSARAGNIYTYMSAVAGVTIPASNATAMVFGLWNKSSNTNLVILETTLGYMHATEVVGEFLWGIKTAAGNAIATGGPISAEAVDTTAIRHSDLTAQAAGGVAGKPLKATTTIVATTAFLPAGFSFPATSGASPTLLKNKYNGEFIVPPLSAIFLLCTAAQTQAMVPSITWEEVPVV